MILSAKTKLKCRNKACLTIAVFIGIGITPHAAAATSMQGPQDSAVQKNDSAAALSQSVKAQELSVSRQGDLDMSCAELSREASLMRDIIAVTEDRQSDVEMQSRGIQVAGALGSFLVGTATGGIGLAAAGYMAKSVMDGNYDEAEHVQETAAQRRSFMMGIYNAKGCLGPMEHVMHTETSPAALADIAPAAGNTQNEDISDNQRYNN